jgi:uncharacterized protein (TIGR02147 family)
VNFVTIPYFRECLNRELTQRLSRNPGYSLRAFARHLEVSSSSLSRALSGKRSLSVPTATRIARKLRLSPRERATFIGSLSKAAKSEQSENLEESIHHLDEKRFRIIADWYHFAILEATYLKNFNFDPKSIAAKFGITVLEASMAIVRLKETGLLEQSGKAFRKTEKTIWAKIGDDFSSDALIEHQKQCLSLAIDATAAVPFAERAVSTMTMPIDRKKVNLAKVMIEEFAMDLCRTLSTGDVSDIFQLTINFHSLLKRENNT